MKRALIAAALPLIVTLQAGPSTPPELALDSVETVRWSACDGSRDVVHEERAVPSLTWTVRPLPETELLLDEAGNGAGGFAELWVSERSETEWRQRRFEAMGDRALELARRSLVSSHVADSQEVAPRVALAYDAPTTEDGLCWGEAGEWAPSSRAIGCVACHRPLQEDPRQPRGLLSLAASARPGSVS